MLKYIAYVNLESGRVTRCAVPNHNSPVDGDIVEDGKSVAKHLTTDNAPAGFENMGQFIQEYWYDFVSDSWVHVGTPPNAHAQWDKDLGDWIWDSEIIMNEIRTQRNIFLGQTDWTQMPDAPLTDEERAAWQQYREQLRNITDTVGNPSSLSEVEWPPLP